MRSAARLDASSCCSHRRCGTPSTSQIGEPWAGREGVCVGKVWGGGREAACVEQVCMCSCVWGGKACKPVLQHRGYGGQAATAKPQEDRVSSAPLSLPAPTLTSQGHSSACCPPNMASSRARGSLAKSGSAASGVMPYKREVGSQAAAQRGWLWFRAPPPWGGEGGGLLGEKVQGEGLWLSAPCLSLLLPPLTHPQTPVFKGLIPLAARPSPK